MLPLGFRFDVDVVVIGGVAHRSDCDQIDYPFGDDGAYVFAGDVHRAPALPQGMSAVPTAVRDAAD